MCWPTWAHSGGYAGTSLWPAGWPGPSGPLRAVRQASVLSIHHACASRRLKNKMKNKQKYFKYLLMTGNYLVLYDNTICACVCVFVCVCVCMHVCVCTYVCA